MAFDAMFGSVLNKTDPSYSVDIPGFSGSWLKASMQPPGGRPAASEANPSGASDVAELRAEPWTQDFEQRAIGRADELSGQRYNAARQQRATDMARQGIGPDSPFWQSEMRKLDVAQADESANFRRQLQLQKIDTHFARTAQARQIEMLMDEMENRRLQELYGMVGGYAPSIDPNLTSALIHQQGQAQAGVGAGFKGIGDLIAAYMATQRPTYNISGGGGGYIPIETPEGSERAW